MVDQDLPAELPHVDLAGWLLGDLDPDEHRRTGDHLAECGTCRAQLDELRPVADFSLRTGPTPQPADDLRDRVLEAVADEARRNPRTVADRPEATRSGTTTSGTPRTTSQSDIVSGWGRWLRSGGLAVAGLALVAAAFVAGVATTAGVPGEVEIDTQLLAVDAATSADVTVRRLDSGRAVDVTSTDLPILPDGGVYELWFVGPGDTPATPNRISAGTFHPDADGVTEVELHAAVVPTDYPIVVITAEPNNGDPAPNGPEVVTSRG